MTPKTKFIVYKIAGYACMAWAIYFFVRAYFFYQGVADLPVTAMDFKVAVTHAVLKVVAGAAVAFVGVLFHYSAGLQKKDIDFF